MSLQIWLPLNGNLNNQGLSNIQPILMGTGITYTAGKIGQAATFPNNCNSCIHFPGLRLQTGSWAAWIKVNGSGATTRQCAISEGRDSYTDGVEFYLNQAGTSLTFKAHEKTISTTIELNKWYHIVGTFGNGEVKFYLNGVLKGTQTYTNDMTYQYASDFTLGKMSYSYSNTSNYFSFNGQLNDVRIYDHTLSVKEVEEISKGLVLHYKLDNNGLGNKNIAKPSTGTATTSSAELKTTTFTGWDNYATNNLALTAAEWANMVGKTITYSMWMENVSQTVGTGTGIMLHFRYADGTYQQFGGGKNGTTGQYLAQGESGWLKLTVTVPDPSTRSNPTTIDRVQYSIRHNSSTGASTVNYQYAKVELGSIQTSWNPYTEETMVYDVSGYSHHGVPVGTITTTSSSPRYSAAASFAASSAINCGRGGMVTDSITVNVWAKYSSYSNLVSCTESGGWNFENNSGLTFPIYISDIGYVHIDSTSRPAVANYANEWHMFTGVYDRVGQQTRLYIDGELIGTGTVSSPNLIRYHGSNVIWLNAEATSSNTTGSYGNAKQMSDFRIYATALSADDIKELYNTSVTIDKDGNVYVREVVEL